MSHNVKELVLYAEEEAPKAVPTNFEVTFDRTTEQQTVQKMDMLLIPVTCMIYLLSFLDRANLGNARVAGLQTQLGLTDHQYQIGKGFSLSKISKC